MLWWLAETTVVAAALAGAVALLCRRLRPRPAVRHALWLVVLLKLLAPPLLAWPRPESRAEEPARPPPAELPAPGPADEVVTVPLPPEVFLAGPAIEAAPAPEPAWADPAPADEPAPAAADPPLVAPRTWGARLAPWVVAAWGLGAVLMALVQLVRIVRFQRQVARGDPAPAALTAAVADLAALLGVRPPPVVVVHSLASPVVWGLGRARLVWPAALFGRLSPDGERAAILHELAHLRRRDHWVGWLHLLGSCVWWWSPLFWHVRGQLGRAAELACDARVIETLPKARRAYAEALLTVCELVSRRAAPGPALGMGGARQEIERRLTMILRESVPSRAPVRALFGVVLLALIALPGFTDGQDGPAVSRTADPATKEEKPATGTQAAPKAAVDEREQRLQKLEANLEALLREVKDLRTAGGKPAGPATNPAVKQGPAAEKPAPPGGTKVPVPGDTPYVGRLFLTGPAPAANEPIRLERVTYTLPKDKAEALATLLKELKAPEVETQVKADGIVVTTTPEAQRVVAEFVSLLLGKLPATKALNNNFASPEIQRY